MNRSAINKINETAEENIVLHQKALLHKNQRCIHLLETKQHHGALRGLGKTRYKSCAARVKLTKMKIATMGKISIDRWQQ